MVRCGRGRVVAIVTEKSAQKHSTNTTNHNLHGLAMKTRPNRYWEEPKIENFATDSYLSEFGW